MIPLWIEVKGLPKHFWQPEMLQTMGEELGEVMDMEITNTSARFRVLINGLQPITKDSMVDFPDSSEALVTFEYKNLKNHCSHCQRLTHEKKHCPGFKAEEEKLALSAPPAPLAENKVVARNYYTPRDNFATLYP